MQIVILFFHHWVETHFVMCFCALHRENLKAKQNKTKSELIKKNIKYKYTLI